MTHNRIILIIKSSHNPKNVAGMARFGIQPKAKVFGMPTPQKRKLAKEIRKEVPDPKQRHELALKLWRSKIHEARFVAALIDDPELVAGKQIDEWVKDFDSWDIVDDVCGALFDKTEIGYKKIPQWAKSNKEFVKRAAFSMIAKIAVHDKNLSDKDFEKYFALIKKASDDERNFVKKAVNWALRQIGKRNNKLKKRAIEVAQEIYKLDSRSAKWIASSALNELKKYPKTDEPRKNC